MQWADLQRIIAEEVAAALARGRTRTCDCHSVCVRLLSGSRARRHRCRRVEAGTLRRREGSVGCRVADRSHTAQGGCDPTGDREALQRGARVRLRHGVRQPTLGFAVRAVCCEGSPTGVCTVVGFPLGATTTDVKQYETRRVIYDGASEVDMVINVGALKSGDLGARRARHRAPS